MTSSKRQIPLLLALISASLVVAVGLGASVSAQHQEPLLVIVSKSINTTNISLAMLRRAFQGEQAFSESGKRLVPLNAPHKTGERELFDHKVLGLEPGEVGRFWINRRIRDEGLPPRTLPAAELGVRAVASFPGAITYVAARVLETSVVRTSIQVLTIDGKSSSDPGYLLAGP